jgi:NDP-sugar pyrophosphorylase family protein
LPGPFQNGVNGGPQSGWDLIDYWFHLEKTWHDRQSTHKNRNGSHENFGTGCRIDPAAEIREPVVIGNHVYIGPDCRIGPYASIGDGCIIEGQSTIENARLTPGTFLCAHTELKESLLASGKVYNLKNRAVIDSLDTLVSVGSKNGHSRTVDPRSRIRQRLRQFWKMSSSPENLAPLDHSAAANLTAKLKS